MEPITRTVSEVKKIWTSGEKSISKVTFTDGTSAKYWGSDKFGRPIEVGVSAACVIEQKPDRQKPEVMEDWLAQWGDPVAKPARGFGGGGAGRQFVPESKWKYAGQNLQYCMTCANNLTAGLVTNGAFNDPDQKDRPDPKAARAFMVETFLELVKNYVPAVKKYAEAVVE